MPQPSKSTRLGKKGGEHRAKTNRRQRTDDVAGREAPLPCRRHWRLSRRAGGAGPVLTERSDRQRHRLVVIVQHLDPTRKGVLASLLQRATTMAVVQVENNTPRSDPGCVYAIPPGRTCRSCGAADLLARAAPRGLRLPIDIFFGSLAEDRHEGSIAVVLSGMGTDGTLGLRTIHRKGRRGLRAGAEVGEVRRHAPQRNRGRARQPGPPGGELPGHIVAYCQHEP